MIKLNRLSQQHFSIRISEDCDEGIDCVSIKDLSSLCEQIKKVLIESRTCGNCEVMFHSFVESHLKACPDCHPRINEC